MNTDQYHYEIRTFGIKNNYTCSLYKVIKHDQLDLIKHTNYKTNTLDQAYKRFIKENNLKERIKC
jgi:predicted secreted protein